MPTVSTRDAVIIDGSHGEGGGQILRTAVGLSVALGCPVTVTRIRLRRPKPGLQPQHLAVVRARAAIADAEVVGDHLGSTEMLCSWRFPGGRASRPSVAVGSPRSAFADVDDHLADQLVPFLALASEPSAYTCPDLSLHLRAVAWVVEQFLPVRVTLGDGSPVRVEVHRAARAVGNESRVSRTARRPVHHRHHGAQARRDPAPAAARDALPNRKAGHLQGLRSLLHDEAYRDRSRAVGELRHHSRAPGYRGRRVPATAALPADRRPNLHGENAAGPLFLCRYREQVDDVLDAEITDESLLLHDRQASETVLRELLKSLPE